MCWWCIRAPGRSRIRPSPIPFVRFCAATSTTIPRLRLRRFAQGWATRQSCDSPEARSGWRFIRGNELARAGQQRASWVMEAVMLEVVVDHLGEVQFEATARGHKVFSDQPVENGGF